VRDLSSDNFGILIAYLLPGFVVLWALRPFVPTVELWLGMPTGTSPTVGGFLYVTIAAVGAGVIISAIRWAIVDQIYHRTGIPAPAWDFRYFPANVAAVESHVQDHYRYYQCYANLLIAVIFGYTLTLVDEARWPGQGAGATLPSWACLWCSFWAHGIRSGNTTSA
jgi:hypothetical protein